MIGSKDLIRKLLTKYLEFLLEEAVGKIYLK